MSYINAIKRKDDVLVWERVNGERKLVMYDAPYYFYQKAPHGEYTSLHGDALERVDFSRGAEFTAEKHRLTSAGQDLYESDVQPELKLLSEKYYNAELPKLHVSLFDIEVDYDEERGYSSMDNPYAPINAIAVHQNWTNTMLVMAVPPPGYDGPTSQEDILAELDKIAPLPTDCNIEIHLFVTEKALLEFFLGEIEDSDVLSGWNSEGYDIPMLGKRLEKLSHEHFRALSFKEGNTPRWKTDEKFGQTVTTLDISGRVSLDYMLIFKKFEVTERPSYKLEAISDEILVDPKTKESKLPKLEYTGSLAGLYKNNFLLFLRYNLRDTEILKGFEDTLSYVELANAFIHLSTGLFKHVTGTLKLSELSTINYCHYDLDNIIVNDVHPPASAEGAKGATVLMPQIGEHKNIGSIDINSLYPSAIRSNNISPETIIGQFVGNTRAYEEIKKRSYVLLTLEFDSGEIMEAPADEWREALIQKNWSISGYGTVFSMNRKGIMPAILEQWYSTRKKYQKLQIEAKEAGDTAKELYYKKLQYVYKIKLNSYYGSLLNQYFRFYDKRMGESTTGTSRYILLHQCAMVTELLDGQYVLPDRQVLDKKTDVTHIGYSKKWSVIYGDTDSTYFTTHTKNVKEATLVADTIGDLVSASFPEFMRESFLCSEGFDDIIKTGREIVADKGIFVDKKRYMLHLVDEDGFKCDKLKVMGLETKKTALPKFVSNQLNDFMERYLKGSEWDEIAVEIVDFKEELMNIDKPTSLGITIGIKNLEKYTKEYEADNETRLPGHVSASIFYNLCLDKFKDVTNPRIVSGMKIKRFILKNKVDRFVAICLPVDMEEFPSWFTGDLKIDFDEQIMRLVDKPLTNIIKAIGKEAPSRQSLMVDNMLEF